MDAERGGEPAAAPRGPRARSGLVNTRISAHAPRREITLEVGRRDIRIRRSLVGPGKKANGSGGRRNAIQGFTAASRRRLLFTARNFPGLWIMVTLTYPGEFPLDGRLVKSHWRRFRQWMVRNGAKTGLWVLEFQQRGAPHFHVFIGTVLDQDVLSRTWYDIVGSGDPRHLQAGTRIEIFRHTPAIGSYVLKYAAKLEQKDVPPTFHNVGRFWGTWGKPEICKKVCIPFELGKNMVRVIRKAHQKERKTWRYRRQFRDNGVAGFIAWESSYLVRRITDELFATGVLHGT